MVGWTTHSHGGEKIYTFWVNLEDKRARLTFAGGGAGDGEENNQELVLDIGSLRCLLDI